MTNRKSHMRFGLKPRSMTLNCYISSSFRRISRDFAHFGVNNCWTNEDSPYCQRQGYSPLNVLFNIKFLVLICCRFLR